MTAYLFSFAMIAIGTKVPASCVNRWLALIALSLLLTSIAITLSVFMKLEDSSSAVQEQAIRFLGLVLMALFLTSYRCIAASPKPKGESCV